MPSDTILIRVSLTINPVIFYLLAGFDDIASVRPFLTVVVQPAYEMGFRATKLLLQHIANRDDAPIEEVVFPLRLIPRESTTALRR